MTRMVGRQGRRDVRKTPAKNIYIYKIKIIIKKSLLPKRGGAWRVLCGAGLSRIWSELCRSGLSLEKPEVALIVYLGDSERDF